MVAELAKINCPLCGTFLIQHPEENKKDTWLKCSCGFCRPVHYSNLPKINDTDSPKKIREKNKK